MVFNRLLGWLRPKRKGGAGAAKARAAVSGDTGLFVRAMSEVSPDFDRLARIDESGARAALAAVYVGMPQTGKASRAAVLRRFLTLKAADEDDQEAAEAFSRLSENATLQVARRSKQPI